MHVRGSLVDGNRTKHEVRHNNRTARIARMGHNATSRNASRLLLKKIKVPPLPLPHTPSPSLP